MSDVGLAHEVSLPLVHFIRQLEGRPPHEVLGEMANYVFNHALAEDIEACVVFADGDRKVQLLAITDQGHAILEEVLNVSEFIPCPVGECEFLGPQCIWCGGRLH